MSESANVLVSVAESPRRADVSTTISTRVRLLNLAGVILPLIGFVAVVALLWGRGFYWVDGGLLLGMYSLTAVGITVGYHRLFTHRAFEANPAVQFVLAVRIFLVHHVTWSINSICHLWGSQPFRTSDHSRNNFVFGALGFGEGWHNNHHASPSSARLGLRWWQIDLGYWFICVLAWLGLASRVKTPCRREP